jgi:chaperonin GroEL (HSP60 family)
LKIQHPCAKLFVDLSQTQSKKFGDGTTTSMLYASELLKICYEILNKEKYSLEELSTKLTQVKEISKKFINQNSTKLKEETLKNAIKTVLISKQIRYEIDLFTELMLSAVKMTRIENNINVESVDGNLKESELIQGKLIFCPKLDYFETKNNVNICLLDIPKFSSSSHVQFESNKSLMMDDDFISIENVDVFLCTGKFPYHQVEISDEILILENLDEDEIDELSKLFDVSKTRYLKNIDQFSCKYIKFFDKNHFILSNDNQTIIVKSSSKSLQEESKI